MFFAAPFWLLGLLPWGATTLWLLWGRRKRQPVPFLPLWQGAVEARRAKWAVQPPPIALLLAIAAAFLALLAAGRPTLRGVGAVGPAVSLIVDRGVTMSARAGPAADAPPRFVAAAQSAGPALERAFGDVAVELLAIPAPPAARPGMTRLRGLPDVIAAMPPTIVDTRAAMTAAVADRLAATRGTQAPVIVLTDYDLSALFATSAILATPAASAAPATLADEDRRRLILIPPPAPWENVGLVSVAATAKVPAAPATAGAATAPATPAARSAAPGQAGQVMVRVHNDSTQTRATLAVRSEGEVRTRDVALPARGGEITAFFDFDPLGPTVEVRLKVGDGSGAGNELAADDRAWLVREASWPRLEPRGELPAEFARLVEVYQKLQPPGEKSAAVALVRSVADAPFGEPAIILAPATTPATTPAPIPATTPTPPTPPPTPTPTGTIEWQSDSAVTANVRWNELANEWKAKGLALAPPPAGEGWERVVVYGGKSLVAVRSTPRRQVWVGFDSPNWPGSVDYVVFWKNVFDWVGGGGEAYVGHAPEALGPEWRRVAPTGAEAADAPPGMWPGLYERGRGEFRAVNVLDVHPGREPTASPAESWRTQITSLRSRVPGSVEGSGFVLLLSLGCLLGSALTWRSRGRAA